MTSKKLKLRLVSFFGYLVVIINSLFLIMAVPVAIFVIYFFVKGLFAEVTIGLFPAMKQLYEEMHYAAQRQVILFFSVVPKFFMEVVFAISDVIFPRFEIHKKFVQEVSIKFKRWSIGICFSFGFVLAILTILQSEGIINLK